MNRPLVAVLWLLCWLLPSIASSQTDATLDAPPSTPPSADAPESPDKPFKVGALFSEFGRELAGLPSKDTAFTLGLGGALALAAHPIDQPLTRSATRSAPVGRAFAAGDVMGAGWVQGTAALTTFAMGHVTGNRRMQAVGLDLVQAGTIVYLMTKSLKLTVDRARPDDGRYSFPSGHAAATFANATVLQRHFGWKAGVPAYALAAYISASRLPDRKHYASDIIFGASLGIVAGRTVTVGRGQATFTVTPTAVPGGGAVVFEHSVGRAVAVEARARERSQRGAQ